MTHPGVGPLTALAYELVIGTPERFHCGKQLASYIGLVPEEKSSGDRRRLGHISKQGNVLLRGFQRSFPLPSRFLPLPNGRTIEGLPTGSRSRAQPEKQRSIALSPIRYGRFASLE